MDQMAQWFGPNLAQTNLVRPTQSGRVRRDPDLTPLSSSSLSLARTRPLHPPFSRPPSSAAPPISSGHLRPSPVPAGWGSGPPRRALPLRPDRFDFPGLNQPPPNLRTLAAARRRSGHCWPHPTLPPAGAVPPPSRPSTPPNSPRRDSSFTEVLAPQTNPSRLLFRQSPADSGAISQWRGAATLTTARSLCFDADRRSRAALPSAHPSPCCFGFHRCRPILATPAVGMAPTTFFDYPLGTGRTASGVQPRCLPICGLVS
jgi:hypothetical protein